MSRPVVGSRRFSNRRFSERGAAMVEFMFVFPMIMMLFTGAVNVGLAVVASSSGTNAAREAARVATVRYECADNHISVRCPVNPSTNYNLIKAAAIARLGGVVPSSSVTVSVQCRQNSKTGTVVYCEKALVKPDNDVVVVTVNWGNKGATRFIPWVSKTTTVAMSIQGRPDLSALAPEPDIYPPALSAPDSCVVKDSDSNGVMDRIEMTFDEDIVQSVSASAFTLTNSVTGSNTITSASVSGRVVTVQFGGATVNTAKGSMNIALTASASGVRDLIGNQASFSSCTLVDRAGPRLIGVSDSNVLLGTDGKIELGDSLTFTFSEPVGLGVAVSTVSESDPNGGGNDTISIPGVLSGTADLMSDNYVTSNATTTTFAAVGLAAGNTVSVTVGANTCVLSCPSLSNGAGTAISFTVSTSIGDSSGNAASGTASLAAGKVF